MNHIFRLLLTLFYVFLSYSGCPQKPKGTVKTESIMGLPLIEPKDDIIKHSGFILKYVEAYEQASWVAYELTAQETNGKFKRTNKFRTDPSVKTKTADDLDYAGSGYDRGHLAPAADMGWSAAAMNESFYYSNMSPQDKSFNRGIWKNLENQVRVWARAYDTVYVVTGPVLSAGLPVIGPNKVAVPELYYKVILDYTLPEKKAIAFVLPNQPSAMELTEFSVSIDSVERLTGIDFFPQLPDEEEIYLEAASDVNNWSWEKINSKPQAGSEDNQKKGTKITVIGTSVQCSSLTTKGSLCKNMTTNVSGKCWRHE